MPIAVDNFSLRFRHIDKLGEVSQQAVMNIVDDYVRARSTDTEHTEIRSKADVNDTYLDKSLDDLTPWYADFRRMVLSLRGPSEHETFDHPVAVFIAISASDPDPMTTITQLYNPNIPSFTVDKPFIDPSVLRYYVILHDPQRATDEQ